MKLIGAGFGRTGTLSLKVALEELGFGPCYHMTEVMNHPRHATFWLKATAGETVDWRAFFAPYQATVDWPACAFYKELMALYPDAKVILTTREPDKWYDSAYETIFSVHERIPHWLTTLLAPLTQSLQVPEQLIWEGTFGGRFADRAYAVAVFQQHNEAVKQFVPANRLLVYQVKEGWEPLCRFLNVPVPEDKPFPHLNDTAQFQQTVQQRVRLAQWLLVGMLVCVVSGLFMLVSRFLR
ncbi:MAG: sulfotransferase [Caldilineaceae bacterium]